MDDIARIAAGLEEDLIAENFDVNDPIKVAVANLMSILAVAKRIGNRQIEDLATQTIQKLRGSRPPQSPQASPQPTPPPIYPPGVG